jgi:hypothetical protein
MKLASSARSSQTSFLKLRKTASELTLPQGRRLTGASRVSRSLKPMKTGQAKPMPVDEIAAYKEFLKSAVRDAESIEK